MNLIFYPKKKEWTSIQTRQFSKCLYLECPNIAALLNRRAAAAATSNTQIYIRGFPGFDHVNPAALPYDQGMEDLLDSLQLKEEEQNDSTDYQPPVLTTTSRPITMKQARKTEIPSSKKNSTETVAVFPHMFNARLETLHSDLLDFHDSLKKFATIYM